MAPPSGILSSIRVSKTYSEANEKAVVFDQGRTIQIPGKTTGG